MRSVIMLVLGVVFVSLKSLAYIPSARMILDRVTENAIKLPLFIEQEVTLISGEQNVVLKEQWLYDDDNTVRLIVRGEKELKDQIVFQNLYTESQKTSTLAGILQSTRQTKPLLDKVFFIHTADSLMRFLVQQGIVNDEIYQAPNFKKVPNTQGKFQYVPTPFIRLGRTSGSVAWVFGPAPKVDIPTPGFWVEQDLFNILKIRNLVGDELQAERPTTFSRGARWPKEMNYSWMSTGVSAQAQVQAVTVRAAEAHQRQLFQKHGDVRTSDFDRHRGRYLVEEFYSKFR